MSMIRCKQCMKIYDTDFQMEVDEKGDCICDRCAERDMPGFEGTYKALNELSIDPTYVSNDFKEQEIKYGNL